MSLLERHTNELLDLPFSWKATMDMGIEEVADFLRHGQGDMRKNPFYYVKPALKHIDVYVRQAHLGLPQERCSDALDTLRAILPDVEVNLRSLLSLRLNTNDIPELNINGVRFATRVILQQTIFNTVGCSFTDERVFIRTLLRTEEPKRPPELTVASWLGVRYSDKLSEALGVSNQKTF